MNNKIIIFTDGASKGNPGPGGYGAIVIYPEFLVKGSLERQVVELGGNEKKTTNNRMELMGAVRALEEIHQSGKLTNEDIIVYTDSKYLIGGMTGWIYDWQKNGWLTADKKEVANKDLWEKLAELVVLNNKKGESKKIKWNYVGGHVGVAGNERCDEIASNMALTEKVDLYKGPLSKYKIDIVNLGHSEEKKLFKNRKSSTAYSYLSLINGVLNIDKTWVACEKRVKGVKNVKYQKATSAEQEKEIIKNWGLYDQQ